MKFSDLELHPKVRAGVESQNYIDCTPIQETAIPHILNGLDIAGLAQTGTGKTAAFLVPLMDRVVRSIEMANAHHDMAGAANETVTDSAPEVAPVAAPETEPLATPPKFPIFEHWRGSQFVLVLVPTRELAEQVSENAKRLGAVTGLNVAAIYGGTSYETQKNALKKGVQFVVATPGRLIDLFKEHLIDLTQVRAVVFDEADRMFDMGFKDDMIYILRRIPKDRQFLVFSATLNFDVLNVAYEFGANPVEVNVSRDQAKAENVNDEILHVGHFDKPKFLLSLLTHHKPKQTIVFSNFKHNVERVAQFLSSNGRPAMAISSLLTQNQRNRVMELFKADNENNILVATDLAARGLDIKGVDLVFNYELPDDPENYVHRIGRTGRAGATGLALSLVSDRDVEALSRIEEYLGHKVKIGWIDDAQLIQKYTEFPMDESRRPRFKENGKRFEGRSQGKRPFEKRPHDRDRQNDRPHDRQHDRQQSRGPGQQSQDGQPRHQGQGRPQQSHSQSGSQQSRSHGHSQRNQPHGQHSHGQKPHRQGQRPQQNQPKPEQKSLRFKHRPQQQAAPKSLATTVSRFLKKLFSSDTKESFSSKGLKKTNNS